MLIRIYHADHNPPHFHVQYGDASAIVEIASGRMLYGKLLAQPATPRARTGVEGESGNATTVAHQAVGVAT